MKRVIIYIGIIALILAGLLYYFFYKALPVEMVKAKTGNIEQTVVDTGYVQAVDDYEIYSEQDGTIVKLSVSRGQDVSKNQVIMVMENRDLSMMSQWFQTELTRAQASVSSAEADLARVNLEFADTQIDYNRTRELLAAGAVSQAQLDASALALNKYRESIEELTNNMQLANEQVKNYQTLYENSKNKEGKLVVKSPIDGMVMKLPIELGHVVKQGALLISLAKDGNLEIKADLLGDDLGEVKIGQKVKIIAPVLGEKVLNGEVAEIYPQAEEILSPLGVFQRRVPVIISLSNPENLKPGYEIRVNVITASREKVTIVPRQAIFTDANGEKQVMKVLGGRIQYVVVKTGLKDNMNIEVIDGLTSGDQIIKDASTIIKENTRVEAAQ